MNLWRKWLAVLVGSIKMELSAYQGLVHPIAKL